MTMTAFISPFWRSTDAVWRRRLTRLLVLAVALMAWTQPASAGSINVTGADLRLSNEVYQLDASFDLHLTSRLHDALMRGVPLTFVAEFHLTQPRHWWWDAHVASVAQDVRLSYVALTRQYLVTTPLNQRRYASLDEALAAMGRIKDWPVLDRSLVERGTRYQAEVRLRLDTSQLPKPLQLYALVNDDWDMASGWLRFPLVP